MIQHCVFLKFKSDITETAIDELLHELSALKDICQGIISISAGSNISPEAFSKGYEHGFVITFRDMQALEAYLPHPDHQRVGAKLVDALDNGTQGLLVFDLEI